MNRREFIVGSSAAVAVAVVGIPAAQPVYFGMDLGEGDSFTLAAWQRDFLIELWQVGPRTQSADEAIKFVETFIGQQRIHPFREGGE